MSIEQIKALAYDEGRKLEVARQNLQVLNQEIAKKENESSKVQEVQANSNDQ